MLDAKYNQISEQLIRDAIEQEVLKTECLQQKLLGEIEKCEALKLALNNTQNQRQAMIHSRSWRVTSFLRKEYFWNKLLINSVNFIKIFLKNKASKNKRLALFIKQLKRS